MIFERWSRLTVRLSVVSLGGRAATSAEVASRPTASDMMIAMRTADRSSRPILGGLRPDDAVRTQLSALPSTSMASKCPRDPHLSKIAGPGSQSPRSNGSRATCTSAEAPPRCDANPFLARSMPLSTRNARQQESPANVKLGTPAHPIRDFRLRLSRLREAQTDVGATPGTTPGKKRQSTNRPRISRPWSPSLRRAEACRPRARRRKGALVGGTPTRAPPHQQDRTKAARAAARAA